MVSSETGAQRAERRLQNKLRSNAKAYANVPVAPPSRQVLRAASRAALKPYWSKWTAKPAVVRP